MAQNVQQPHLRKCSSCGTTIHFDQNGQTWCRNCTSAAAATLPSFFAERRSLERARERATASIERARRAGRKRALTLLTGAILLALFAWVAAAWYVSVPFLLLAIGVAISFSSGALERTDEETLELRRSIEAVEARIAVVDRHVARVRSVTERTGPESRGR